MTFDLITVLFLLAAVAYIALGVSQCIKPFGLSRYTARSVGKFRGISIACYFVSAVACCLVAFGIDNLVLAIIGCVLLLGCFLVLIFSSIKLEHRPDEDVDDDVDNADENNSTQGSEVDDDENYIDKDEEVNEYSEGFVDDARYDDEYEDNEEEDDETIEDEPKVKKSAKIKIEEEDLDGAEDVYADEYQDVSDQYDYKYSEKNTQFDDEYDEKETTTEDEYTDFEEEEETPPRKRRTRTKTKTQYYDDEE